MILCHHYLVFKFHLLADKHTSLTPGKVYFVIGFNDFSVSQQAVRTLAKVKTGGSYALPRLIGLPDNSL